MTLPVNERTEVSQTNFEPASSVKAEKPAKATNTKDTLSSAAPKEAAEPKKTFGEKLKAFFSSIWTCIKHLLCCFNKKKAANDSAEKPQDAQTPKTEAEENEDIEKGMAFRRFNKLEPDLKQEWLRAVRGFKEKQKNSEENEKLILVATALWQKREDDVEQIVEFIDKADLTEDQKKDMRKGFVEDKEDYFQRLDRFLNLQDVEKRHGELRNFIAFVDNPSNSALEIEAVYRNLSMRSKERLLAAYKAENEKAISSEKLLQRLLQNPPKEQVVKMFHAIRRELAEATKYL